MTGDDGRKTRYERHPHPQWLKPGPEPIPVMRVEVGLSALVDAEIILDPRALTPADPA